MESDKRGLALAVIRKRRLVAQTVVVRLSELAHNVLVWARGWLAQAAPRLRSYGVVRLVQEVWAVPGRVKRSRAADPAGALTSSPPFGPRRRARLAPTPGGRTTRPGFELTPGDFGPNLGSCEIGVKW